MLTLVTLTAVITAGLAAAIINAAAKAKPQLARQEVRIDRDR